MRVFNYHPITKEFISESVADKDPRNSERHLIPSFATNKPKPQVGLHEVAQFIDGDWIVSEDNRGTEYWVNGEKHTIENIGDSVPVDASLTEPEQSEDEREHQEASNVRVKRDRLLKEVSDRYDRYARETRLGINTTDELNALDQYAQALADIPLQSGFPFDIEWPVKPL